MKKWLCLGLLPVFLVGCGKQEAYETVSDEFIQPVAAVMQQAAIQIPEGAVVAAMHNDETGSIYFCDDYTMTLQTMESGDLNKTVYTVTGYTKEQLDMIETAAENAVRYDCVWVSAGESEEQVGRAAILDDGNYHYVLTCMTNASDALSLQEAWQTLFSSFCITEPGVDPYTGS